MSTRISTYFDRFLYWIRWAATILLGGCITVSIVFMTAGSLMRMDYPLKFMAAKGFVDGFIYLTLWAPGIALAMTIMREHRRAKAN